MSEPRLGPDALGRIAEHADASGLLKLGVVRLDHPGFESARAAIDRFVAAGFHGEMGYMERTLEVRKDPTQMLPGARSAFVVAVPYRGEPDTGVARYAHSADYHTVMHSRLEAVVGALKAEVPQAEALVCVDTKPLLERTAAALAGLGFIGKHGCVIVPGLGSYVLLGAVLTDALWTGHDEVQDLRRARWDACGACTRCLDACPTQAFDAPGVLDPRRCISYLTLEHRGAIDDTLAEGMGGWVAGCDVCQEVCPYNASGKRESRVRDEVWLPNVVGGPRPADPVALAQLGSSRHRAFVRDTALRRIPRRSLRRNALIALGNRAGKLSEEEDAAVCLGEADTDSQVQAAAGRARRRRR
ncbi:MAG: tRNA epoxyqueuosine(34) reductase QueG [Nannocystaceae bacterium]|nr:tRNA epoxyqueuosine(34) reductase QueG [Nannocystaceae bacterium]